MNPSEQSYLLCCIDMDGLLNYYLIIKGKNTPIAFVWYSVLLLCLVWYPPPPLEASL